MYLNWFPAARIVIINKYRYTGYFYRNTKLPMYHLIPNNTVYYIIYGLTPFLRYTGFNTAIPEFDFNNVNPRINYKP